jgi:undecaprenyl phosphate N,N'-diacetylbacillosamine 1-phosphate transferase
MYIRFLKRPFDILVSAALLVVLSPLIAVIALAIGVTIGPPVLFRQERPGHRERLFTMVKFRSMSEARQSNGRPLPESKRLTAIGRLLRATSLDELPELVNVLKGDMSLVGPRPLLTRYLPFYSPEERNRSSVRPGITGLAQVSGRNDLPWSERLAMDVEYARNCSFWLDVRILFATASRVLHGEGMQVDPGAVMDDLDVERSRMTARRAANE